MGVSVTALARSNAAATDASATAVGITRKPGQAPIVVYIAGSGRSGSTLLERALGEIQGFVNVGELIDLYRRVADHGERCGCGQEFAQCPFWSQVGERAVGGWQEQKLVVTRDLQGKVARQRRMPRLLAMPLAGSRFRTEVNAYGASYAGLYEAIAAEAGATCVVDASKWPVQALALARAGLDVRVIHLVRDVRGVAYSLGKRDVSRPHAVGEADVMTRLSPAEAAARWVAVQSQAGLLRWCGLPAARMRYEDFVRRPRQAVEAALAGIGLSVSPAHLAHIGDGRVMLGTSHGLSGNPSRFRDGEITLRADETWRASMSRRDRLIVTAIALPLMLRYGITAARSPAEKQDAHD
jgi:Sulfotransferase family